MEILDLAVFIENGMVTETAFFEQVESHDWSQYQDRRVLVKGCGTTIVPPWAFMVVASRLASVAKVVRYGNEHSSVSVFRRSWLNKEKPADEADKANVK